MKGVDNMETTGKGMDIKFECGGEFVNFKPVNVLTLLAELFAKQEGRVAKDIQIFKKGERIA